MSKASVRFTHTSDGMCPANECQERERFSDKPYQLAHVVTCSKAIIYHSSASSKALFRLVFRDISLYSAPVQCNIPLESSQSVSVSGDTKKRRARDIRKKRRKSRKSETRLDMDSYRSLFSFRKESSSSSRAQETDIIFGCVIRMRNNEVNGFQFEIKLIFIELDSVSECEIWLCVGECLGGGMDESLLCEDCELP